MFGQMAEALQKGDSRTVQRLVRQALEEGYPAKEILAEGLLTGMDTVGQLFKRNEIYLPEVMAAARAMDAALTLLKPVLLRDRVEPLGTAVLGTVRGDHHDIGKNLVKIMLEGVGFAVTDLGVNVPPARFVEAVRQYHPRVLGMSALLTTTMREMESVMRALADAGLRDQVIVLVGGAPVTAEFARGIGADLYAADAASCAEQVKALVSR